VAKLDVKPTPMDLGSSDGVLVCYQKIYSLVRLARKKKIKKAASLKLQAPSSVDNGSRSM